ncbi:MAG TPA: hypothetical protein VHC43_08000 [Mycobacteriales bacterium]|nr:hypothetical protein [Mycobacteriales bacterium]
MGRVERSVAVSLVVVLIAGVVTAITRSTGGSGRTQGSDAASRIAHRWVRVVDPKVGFIARLPRRPTDFTLVPNRPGGPHVDGAAARDGRGIVIERFAIPAVSATELARIFRSSIASLATGAGFEVESEGPSTFRGQIAREGRYVTDSGKSYQAMIFVDGAGDLYLIAAPARYFETLTRSFQVYVPPDRPLGG